MNIILDKLPLLTPSNKKISTDFRDSIRFELLMQDNTIDDATKIQLAINLYYDEVDDIKEAIQEILWFYRCGKEIKSTRK